MGQHFPQGLAGGSSFSPFLSFPCSASPAKPPGSRASEVGCPRVGHADCVSQKRVRRAGQRRAGFRAAPRSRQAGRGDGRGWGLRVPPAAPPVLSGHRQGDVKGCGGRGVSRGGGGTGTVAEKQRVASVLPPSGAGGQTGTMWRPKLSA